MKRRNVYGWLVRSGLIHRILLYPGAYFIHSYLGVESRVYRVKRMNNSRFLNNFRSWLVNEFAQYARGSWKHGTSINTPPYLHESVENLKMHLANSDYSWRFKLINLLFFFSFFSLYVISFISISSSTLNLWTKSQFYHENDHKLFHFHQVLKNQVAFIFPFNRHMLRSIFFFFSTVVKYCFSWIFLRHET